MPSYKVIAPGFYQGMHYNPIGKRNVLHTDKPFSKKNIPSWLIAMPKESTAVSEKRELQEDSVKQASDDFAELIVASLKLPRRAMLKGASLWSTNP